MPKLVFLFLFRPAVLFFILMAITMEIMYAAAVKQFLLYSAKYLAVFFLTGLSCSCVRETDLTPEGDAHLVVECILTSEPTQFLTLSMTDLTDGKSRPFWEDAQAILYDETERATAGVFVMDENGTGCLDYCPAQDHIYRLDISVPGVGTIKATTCMPAPVQVQWKLSFLYDNNSDGLFYSISPLPISAWWVYAMETREAGSFQVAERIATDYDNVDSFNVIPDSFADENTLGTELLERMYPRLRGADMHDKLLRFPPAAPEDRDKSIERLVIGGNFSGMGMFTDEPVSGKGYLVFMSVSEEYDLFMKDAIGFILKKQAAGLFSIYLRNNPLYSNIEGGLGIFGAAQIQKMPWTDRRYNYPWELDF